MAEPTELQSRQARLKAIVRCISVIDLIHMTFPVTCFSNLSVFAVLILLGQFKETSNGKNLLAAVPIGIVGIIACVYGAMVVLRLFNATHPVFQILKSAPISLIMEVPPNQSADMAMWWCHYSLALIAIEMVGAAIFIYLGMQDKFLVGEIFSFAIIFSVATRLVCLYMVRKMIRVLRKTEVQNISTDDTPSRITTIRWHLPLASSHTSTQSQQSPKKQNELQMIFLTQILTVADLMQNTFMVITLVYVSLAFVANVEHVSSSHWSTPVEVGGLISLVILCIIMICLFCYGIYTGRNLLSSTDEISDLRHQQEMPEANQLRLSAVVRKWLIGSFLCLLLLEVMCLARIIVFTNLAALVYSAGLSFSISIRAVSFYFINLYRKTFFTPGIRTTRRKPSKMVTIKVAPDDIEDQAPEEDIKEADMTETVKSVHLHELSTPVERATNDQTKNAETDNK